MMRVAQMDVADAKSLGSYKSTHSTRSSVLQRAREYNQRLETQKARRSKSLERQSDVGDSASTASGTPRSQSAGRMPSNFQGNRPSTRERAMASVKRESLAAPNMDANMNQHEHHQHHNGNDKRNYNGANHHNNHRGGGESPLSIEVNQATPHSRVSGASGAHSSHVSRPTPTTPRMSGGFQESGPPPPPQQQERQRNNGHRHRQQQQLQVDHNNERRSSAERRQSRNDPTPRESPSRSVKSSQRGNNNKGDENQDAVVTPELLVDALSGHEDGLLAIAEKLMEHYDSGYDVMGEAIIDAFADVQKLFQHVVEAAHMEGAAFESSRHEEEIAELRKQAAAAGGGVTVETAASPTNGAGGPSRHDEFIDQDVKDVLTESIRKGTNYRNNDKFSECYQLYEHACQSASSLLPVDSDHRGRLQLSIARAESMNAERACAILRYAMDDVLRSGLRAGSAPAPDPSQRADVVLSRPKGSRAAGVQSSEEALNSLVEEMREVMHAPVYDNTPLQSVAKRFLAALADAQKAQHKNEEKLEQNLAKLKGDFLLARAEWEEKLNSTQETSDIYKEKYQKLKESVKKQGNDASVSVSGSSYLDHARSALASQQQRVGGNSDEDDTYNGYSTASRAGSHASMGTGLASQARDGVRSLVGSFSCGTNPRHGGGVGTQEFTENRDAEIREMAFRHDSGMRDRDRRRTNDNKKYSGGGGNINMSYSDRSYSSENQSQQSTAHQRRTHTPHSVASGSTRSKSSRSFREYSRSPKRVDF